MGGADALRRLAVEDGLSGGDERNSTSERTNVMEEVHPLRYP